MVASGECEVWLGKLAIVSILIVASCCVRVQKETEDPAQGNEDEVRDLQRDVSGLAI